MGSNWKSNIQSQLTISNILRQLKLHYQFSEIQKPSSFHVFGSLVKKAKQIQQDQQKKKSQYHRSHHLNATTYFFKKKG